jgi:hypothetical protein
MVLKSIERRETEIRHAEAADKVRTDQNEASRTTAKQELAEAEARWEEEYRAWMATRLQRMGVILQKSGVLQALRDIESARLRSSGLKHALVLGGNSDSCYAMLAWGKIFRVEEAPLGGQYITYERHRFLFFQSDPGTGEADYSYIKVLVNPDSAELEINGERFPNQVWKQDEQRVLDALAEAYLNPTRVVYTLSDEPRQPSINEMGH